MNEIYQQIDKQLEDRATESHKATFDQIKSLSLVEDIYVLTKTIKQLEEAQQAETGDSSQFDGKILSNQDLLKTAFESLYDIQGDNTHQFIADNEPTQNSQTTDEESPVGFIPHKNPEAGAEKPSSQTKEFAIKVGRIALRPFTPFVTGLIQRHNVHKQMRTKYVANQQKGNDKRRDETFLDFSAALADRKRVQLYTKEQNQQFNQARNQKREQQRNRDDEIVRDNQRRRRLARVGKRLQKELKKQRRNISR